jgi:hypothetical protein
MEFSRDKQCAIIKCFCAKGENCVNIHRELVWVCGDTAMWLCYYSSWICLSLWGYSNVTVLIFIVNLSQFVGIQQCDCYYYSSWSCLSLWGYSNVTVLLFIVNLSQFVGIVLWTTAMWIDGWQNLKREECPAPTCRAQGDRALLAGMPTKNVNS